MGLLDLITADEREMIRLRVEEYALTNDSRANTSNWNFDRVFHEWEWSKAVYLSKIFKTETGEDTLILRKPVEFLRGIDELVDEFSDIMYPRCFEHLMSIFDTAAVKNDPNSYWYGKDYHWDYTVPECLDSLDNSVQYNLRSTIYKLCTLQSLAANVYNDATIEIPLPTGKKLKINRGCRVIKMLGKLIEAFGLDIKEFEEFRIKHSQILNQKAVKGTLCLSIHPLDYITMSDNDSGWESCMSWENHGCYRQGTVEMMNSDMVIVAYLESEKPMKIANDLYWSNKKWRELYIVHQDVIANVKGYPYCNEHLTAAVLDWLRELVHKSEIYGNDHYLPTIYSSNRLSDDLNMIFSFYTNLMYNDFGHEYHYCVVSSKLPYGHRGTINYSGSSQCMLCGELDPCFANVDGDAINLVCESCDDVQTCDCCGSHIYGDEYTTVGDEVICNCCFDDYYVYDAVNETYIHTDMARSIHICNEDGTAYVDDYELEVVTSEYTPAALLSDSDSYVILRKSSPWSWRSGRNIYCIKQGTWTQTFLNALRENLYGADDEQVVLDALSEAEWTKI